MRRVRKLQLLEWGAGVAGQGRLQPAVFEFWLSFQNLIPPQTLGSQLDQAVLKVGAVEPTTLH